MLIFYAHIHQLMKQLVLNKNKKIFLVICSPLRFMPYLVGIVYNDCVRWMRGVGLSAFLARLLLNYGYSKLIAFVR